jgi:hypothetical protein
LALYLTFLSRFSNGIDRYGIGIHMRIIKIHVDGDLYERRKSVLPNFSGEAKNFFKKNMRKLKFGNLTIDITLY